MIHDLGADGMTETSPLEDIGGYESVVGNKKLAAGIRAAESATSPLEAARERIIAQNRPRCLCGRVVYLPSWFRDEAAPGFLRCLGCDLLEHLCRCRPIKEPQVEQEA